MAPIVLETPRTAPGEAFDFWREVTRTTYDLRADRGTQRRFALRSTSWHAGQSVFVDCEAETNVKVRARRLIERNGGAYVKLRWYESGKATIAHGDTAWAAGPGAFFLIDQGREVTEASERNRQKNVFLPYSAIGYEPDSLPAVLDISFASAQGRVLRSVLDSTFAGIDDMCREDLATTGQALAALLREYLGMRTSLPEAGLIGRARGKAMRDYVERHLLDDALGADVLADRFAASRATVYRAFAEQDGLSRYIWARRVARAYHDLAHTPPHRGAIAAVAERYRFSTASHFNRAFRQAHGVRPSDVLGLAVGAGTDLTVDSRETFDRDALEQVRNLYALIAGSDRARS